MFDVYYLENGWRHRLGCNGVPIGCLLYTSDAADE